jgi:DNA-binding transcriptional MerR regulator
METGIRGKTYKIGQAAKLLDVKPFVLRFWESEFKDVLVPIRTPAGQRAYSQGNIDTVREIKRLLYDEGLTIEGAKKRLGQPQSKAARARAASPEPPDAAEPAPSGPAPTVEAAAAPGSQPEAMPAPQVENLRDTLRDTLRTVRRELTLIRDLLGD